MSGQTENVMFIFLPDVYKYIYQVAVLLARCPLGGGSCDKECATVEVEDEVLDPK